MYVLTTDGDEFVRIQQELLTILDEVAAAGTALALPTQASIVIRPHRSTARPVGLRKGRAAAVANGRH